MTPDEALKFVTNLAQTALGAGAYKDFKTAKAAADAIEVLAACVETQRLTLAAAVVDKTRTDGQ
jgi:hypothetical protein